MNSKRLFNEKIIQKLVGSRIERQQGWLLLDRRRILGKASFCLFEAFNPLGSGYQLLHLLRKTMVPQQVFAVPRCDGSFLRLTWPPDYLVHFFVLELAG